MKELFYLPNLSLVLSFILLSTLYFIPVHLVLQGVGKWDTEEGKEMERGRQSAVFTCTALNQYVSVGSLWESPLAFTLDRVHSNKRAPAHTLKKAALVSKEINWD